MSCSAASPRPIRAIAGGGATRARSRGIASAGPAGAPVAPIGPGGVALATIVQPRSGLRFLAGLSHPNIVSLLDKIEADGQVWFVDEPADGVTLEAVLAGRRPADRAPQSFGIVRGVLKGLAYVHNSRALHGDISPSTVLLDHRGTARLGDFGRPSLPGSRPMRRRSRS